MKKHAIYLLYMAVCIGCGWAVAMMGAQQSPTNAHLETARTAIVGCQDASDLFDNLCENRQMQISGAASRGAVPQPAARGTQPAARGAAGDQPSARSPRPVPEWSTYHAEPMKIFDNLYFVGSKSETCWLVPTSAGIILIDALSSYATEDEVWSGIKKLGFNPNDVKALLLSHGHGDHTGGAKFLQDHIPGLQTYLSEPDWDLLYKDSKDGKDSIGAPLPKRDKVISDGGSLTLGDATIRFTIVPGHTPGNTAMLIPVREGNQKHLAALWAGTGLQQTSEEYFRTYAASAAKFRDIAVKAGADVFIGGHPHRDGSNRKMPMMATRKPGDPNPYVIGVDGIRRVMTVISECAAYKADLAKAGQLNGAGGGNE